MDSRSGMDQTKETTVMPLMQYSRHGQKGNVPPMTPRSPDRKTTASKLWPNTTVLPMNLARIPDPDRANPSRRGKT